jgi:GAF domain-containing protein
MSQGKLVALLYLENNLAPRVFTPARVAILKFLASEAATSLENARLYHALRERESRIHRLVDANIIGICFFGPGGDILEANHAFLKTVGYDREDVSTGRLRWTNLTPPEWNDAPRTPMQSWKRLALSSRSKKSTSAKMAAALRY